jgi:hypothetical protein
VATLIIVIAICVVVALGIFFWSRQGAASRRNAIRQYTDEHHFTFLGNRIPDTLNLDRSSFRSAENISSAFTGTGKEKEFAFFDCSMRDGRRGYTQSVLAIYRLEGSYPACQFDRQLREEHAGDWRLIYHDRRTWPVSEIDAHLSSI